MRILTTLIFLIATTVAIAQTRPASTVLDGSWRSPDLGLDFPIWMVDTYNADGSVQIEFYSKPKLEEIHHADKTRQAHWRIANNSLELGKLNESGEFKREGQPRPIKTDRSGKVIAIEEWTRLATTQPIKPPDEFVKPPEAELARIRDAAIFAETAKLAGLDWETYYLTFMKLERRKDWTDKQIKFIGMYFGAMQGWFRKENADMKFTEHEIEALRAKLKAETARLENEATTRPYRTRSE